MKHSFLTIALAGLAFLWANPDVLSNPSPRTGYEITADRLREYNVKTGLSNNTVYCIEKDRYGFLWFGTENGLNRYDSREWMHYFFNPSDPASLSNSKVLDILSDISGRLWIATAKGLNRYDFETNEFEKVGSDSTRNSLPGFYIRSLFEDSDSDIWIGTSDGLALIPEGEPDNGIQTFNLGRGGGNENNIVDIYEDSEGMIWVGTTDGLFYTRNKKDFFLFNLGIRPDENLYIRTILEVGNLLFIATENRGLYIYNRRNDQISLTPLINEGETLDPIFRALMTDQDSCLWIATTDGLFCHSIREQDPDTGTPTRMQVRKILDNSVRTLFEDENNGLWIGTQYNGLYYHYPENFLFNRVGFKPYSRNGLNNAVVSSFLVQGDSVWIGTDGGGINLWLRKQDRFLHWTEADGLVNNNIKSLAMDSGGRLWISTFKGLSIMNDGRFLNYDLTSPTWGGNPKLSNHILSLYLDEAHQRAWLGTDGSGLVAFDTKTMKVQPVSDLSDRFKPSSVNTILPRSDSLLILGTSSGLYQYNKTKGQFTKQTLIFPSGEPIDPYVFTLEPEGDKGIWIGTEKFGLIHLNMPSGRVRTFPELNSIPGISIHAIRQIGENELWCSGNRGLHRIIFRFSGDSLFTTNFDSYTESFNVQSSQFMPRSSFLTKKQELFFGGIEGYNYFYPGKVKVNSREIPVFLKSLTYWDGKRNAVISQEKIYPREFRLSFDHHIRDITLEFVGINYPHPENTIYSYRFSEEGDQWISLGSRNLMTFNHLSNGNYLLELNAHEKSGQFSTDPVRLTLTINPPFWKSGIALAIYVIAILFLLYLFYLTIRRWERLRADLRLSRVRREQEEQLHEQRLRFFTDISHELRTPLTLILSPIDMIIKNHTLSMRVLNTLQMVKQNGERMLQLINQLLDLRKADQGYLKFRAARGNIIRFIQEVCLSFRDLVETRDITLEFKPGSESIIAYFDRDKLEIVINNLLSNAVKHTPDSGKIVLSVEEHPDKGDEGLSRFPDGFVQVIIEDQGKGIPPDKIDKIFDRFFEGNSGIKGTGLGLEIARKYVKLHGGTIKAESETEDTGKPGYSKFIIRLPLGRKHISDEEILENYLGSDDIKSYTARGKSTTLHPDLEEEIEKMQIMENGSSSRYSLMVIEDNPELRQFLTRILGEKYKVEGAENGEKAWEMLLKDPPDLIISDIMMPGMSGIELCRKIKTDVRTSHLPVILLTARTAITFKYEGLETGADEYITKPFQPEYLELKIRNLLYQREILKRRYLKESITDPELITLTSLDEKMLKKAIDFIHEHIDKEDLSIESISDHLGMSRVHFYRKMKAITGITPQEFLKTVRLKYAASLLSQKKLRISEVAYLSGYKDIAYFSKSFKQFFGQTPSGYAENQVKREDL